MSLFNGRGMRFKLNFLLTYKNIFLKSSSSIENFGFSNVQSSIFILGSPKTLDKNNAQFNISFDVDMSILFQRF